MKPILGIRREDKNRWERRSPLTPKQVRDLIQGHGIQVIVQPSPIRAFSDDEYRRAGAEVQEDLSPCSIVLGVKEMPLDFFQSGVTYLFFSHTIKGQSHNLPLLRKIIQTGSHLIDYERITDHQGRRLVLFGRHAGLAGMIETLHALGKRLEVEGTRDNPFAEVLQPHRYSSIEEAKNALTAVGRRVAREGLPSTITPCIIGILGYGNVSKGAQEILESCFPIQRVTPGELAGCFAKNPRSDRLYVTVFREEDTVEHTSPHGEDPFSITDYYEHPERYRSKLGRFLRLLTVLVNAVYWDPRFPVLVSAGDLAEIYRHERPRLRVIGDISCDIEGSIAVTRKATSPDQPCYVYDTVKDEIMDGYDGPGPVIMAVDNLPCEFPRESSEDFGRALLPFLPSLCRTDFSRPTDELDLPESLRSALIVHAGSLTETYRYLQSHLAQR